MANTSQGTGYGGRHRGESDIEWDKIQDVFTNAWVVGLTLAILLSALSAAIGKGWIEALKAFFTVAGIGTAVVVASGTFGWLFGLLFGIPRSIARAGSAAAPVVHPPAGGAGTAGQPAVQQHATDDAPANTPPASPLNTPPASRAVTPPPSPAITSPPSQVNTNLEDVSDWLTKTIIGVGLTQLFAVPHVAWKYAMILDKASLKGDGGGALLILSLAAAGGAGAFWISYVGTRTFLTRLFDLFARLNPSGVSTQANATPSNSSRAGGADAAKEPGS